VRAGESPPPLCSASWSATARISATPLAISVSEIDPDVSTMIAISPMRCE
jgi:hypothetical protein